MCRSLVEVSALWFEFWRFRYDYNCYHSGCYHYNGHWINPVVFYRFFEYLSEEYIIILFAIDVFIKHLLFDIVFIEAR